LDLLVQVMRIVKFKMKKKIIKYLLMVALVIISFAAGFGLSEYLREKNRAKLSAMAELAGICAYEDKDLSTGLENLYVAIFFDPSNGGAHLGLGHLFYDQGLYDLSLHEFEKYLQNPKSGVLTAFSDKEDRKWEKFAKHDIAWAYCYMGDIHDKNSDKENSLKNYRKASESDPEFTRFLEIYIKFINDKREKKDIDFQKLERLNKFFSRIREAEREVNK
jgi:tetratricopeptide (TPR) repeat protein